ncbi:putative F-box protein At2g19630 [Quercus robur]|uniref:putative F-box protein At2g19630 n=1 Tax=Quercus robur TaxID=38942 RepID=UPI002162A18E|nr:putative F-box protein At2g19630 [Quercus robur]
MSLDNLPDGLLLKILLHLPLQSVFQCKCVSNRWCSLISTPYFTHRYVSHLHTNLQPFTLLFECKDDQSITRVLATNSDEPELKSLAAYVHRQSEHLWLEASSNDLLLWRAKDDEEPIPMSVYYVINPITRQCVELPPIPLPYHRSWIQAGLICSYDYNKKQLSYSVVLIPYFHDKLREFKVYIFSSNTREWSESMVLCLDPEGFELTHFALCAVPYKSLLFWCSNSGRLLGIDPSILRIWELKDYDNEGGGKWYLEHEVSVNQLVSKKSPWLTEDVQQKYPLFLVLAFHPNDGDILYLAIELKVLLCNLRSKTVEVFCDVPHDPDTRNGKCNIINFVLPSWPTPIPFAPSQNGA